MLASDHLFWHLTRASGFVAYLLLYATLSLGLLMSTNLVGRSLPRHVVYDLHRFLTLVTLAFTAFHLLIVLPDGYFSFSLTELLLPFASPYRPVYMALGAVAFYSLMAVWLSFYLRDRVGYRTWRLFHYVTFGLFLAAFVHGIGAGSDSSTIWAKQVYLVSAILLAGLLFLRLLERSNRGLRVNTGPPQVSQNLEEATEGGRSNLRDQERML